MQDVYRIIDQDPRFHALERRRSRFAWRLSAIVLAAYYGFILIIAFNPALFARQLHATTIVTWGIAAGLAVMFVSVALTGVYVWRANREFDAANAAIVADALASARRAGQAAGPAPDPGTGMDGKR